MNCAQVVQGRRLLQFSALKFSSVTGRHLTRPRILLTSLEVRPFHFRTCRQLLTSQSYPCWGVHHHFVTRPQVDAFVGDGVELGCSARNWRNRKEVVTVGKRKVHHFYYGWCQGELGTLSRLVEVSPSTWCISMHSQSRYGKVFLGGHIWLCEPSWPDNAVQTAYTNLLLQFC